jgi:molybdate transport system permease protein
VSSVDGGWQAFEGGPLWLTLQLALVTTLLLAALGIPLAAWLAGTLHRRLRIVVEALVSLPLVLPPSVLGFYLLISLGPRSLVGGLASRLAGVDLVFTFEGLVVGSVVFSLPFMVHPVRAALASLPPSLKEAAWTLGASRLATFRRVLLPNVGGALLSGAVLSFAHTVGEFGVVLMIGGNVPGETRVASIAIYDAVESLRYAEAHRQAAVLTALSFAALVVLYARTRKGPLAP